MFYVGDNPPGQEMMGLRDMKNQNCTIIIFCGEKHCLTYISLSSLLDMFPLVVDGLIEVSVQNVLLAISDVQGILACFRLEIVIQFLFM